MLENIAFLPTRREKNHPIINIVSGGRGELARCPNLFVRDCRWDNLDGGQYPFQPIKFVNLVVPNPCYIEPYKIYAICRLGGPYSEKRWPWAWKCCPRPHGPTLGRQITFNFFPAVNWFYRLSQMGFFTQLSLNRLARRLLTIFKNSSQRRSNSDIR